MTMDKSERELAFLYDLYIAPDWGERFAELIDKHVKLPAEGNALYVAVGTGSHALALRERGGANFSLVGVDESDERLALARAKAAAVKSGTQTEFRHSQLETLDFSDDQFGLIIGNASLVAPERWPEALAEMVRVAVAGGRVAFAVTTTPSFGEFYSIFWEALNNAELDDYAVGVEDLVKEQPTVSDLELLANESGLIEIQSWTQKEEFTYASGEAFLADPLVAEFLLPYWMKTLPPQNAAAHERVKTQIVRVVDEESSGTNFVLSVKATLVVGRKSAG